MNPPPAAHGLLHRLLIWGIWLLSSTLPAAAQNLKEGNAADALKLSPEDQQKQFVLADGFSIELVTSEVQGAEKMVALNFDDSGRLWTMTATEYPLDTNDKKFAEEARKKWRDGGKDRVLVIDKPLLAGPHTPRIFAEGMVMPMSVLPCHDGAIVAQGPEMLLLRDTNGDGKADERKVLIKGFGIQDTHTLPHNLMWLPDGSIFSAQGILNEGKITDAAGKPIPVDYGKFATFRPDGTNFQLYGAGLNNTWGLMLTRLGQLWGQEANVMDHPVAPIEEGVHLHGWNEKPYLPDAPWQPGVGEVNMGGTGLSGLARSEDVHGGFPEPWRKPFLIANAVTGAINSLNVEPKPGGGWVATRGPDLVTCHDKRFRPVHILFGPDSCLYIVDWYNPIISHNEIPRDHPSRDKTSGRLWRVRHTTQTRSEAPDVAAATNEKLIGHLRSSNTWEMRAAWRQIVERKATGLISRLTELVRGLKNEPDDVRIIALWTLGGLGYANEATWTSAFVNPSPDVRREALRALSTASIPLQRSRTWLLRLTSEPDFSVRNEFARYLRSCTDATPADLAMLLAWQQPFDPAKIKGSQGPTLTPQAYPQAFLNMQIRRTLDVHRIIADQLAEFPELMAKLPLSVKAQLYQAGYGKRISSGAVTLEQMQNPEVLDAALSLARDNANARELLRKFAAQCPRPAEFAARVLNQPGIQRPDLLSFCAPLALRLLAAEQPRVILDGLDLAALSCTVADGTEFLRHARSIVAKYPQLRLPTLRCAITMGVRDVDFYSSEAARETADPGGRTDVRSQAAAWIGWQDSASSTEDEALDATLHKWLGKLSPEARTTVLDEFISTTIGSHFALKAVLPDLLAQDATTLSRIADELGDRVSVKGPAVKVLDASRKQREIRSVEIAKRIETFQTAINSGVLKPNSSAGQPLFTSLCLTCHAAGGKGVGFAPPLDGSSKRDVPSLLLALLDPDAAVENVFRPYQVRLRDGSVVEGFLKSLEGNMASIQMMGGATQTVNLLRAHTYRHIGGHSIMPALATGLTDQQLTDLLAYVRSL